MMFFSVRTEKENVDQNFVYAPEVSANTMQPYTSKVHAISVNINLTLGCSI